jgi:hypothetical protein
MPFHLARNITKASPELSVLVDASIAFLDGYDDWLGWVRENLLYGLNSVLLMDGASKFKR